MAKFRFTTDGFKTIVELDGKTMGPGVQRIDFLHEGGEKAKLLLNIDLHDFSFLPDGEFDKREAALMEGIGQCKDE